MSLLKYLKLKTVALEICSSIGPNTTILSLLLRDLSFLTYMGRGLLISEEGLDLPKQCEVGSAKFCLSKQVRVSSFLARLNNIQEELLYYRWRLCPQMIKFCVKVFRTSMFPNPMMYLVHVWCNQFLIIAFLFTLT